MRHLTALLIALALGFGSYVAPASAQGLNRGADIRTSCVRLAGLVTVLNQVVNQQQIYNHSTDIYGGQGDCTLVFGRSFTPDRLTAQQYGITRQVGGFIGWIVTDKWLVPVEHIAYLDRAKETSYRPADILDRRRFTLPELCFGLTQQVSGTRIVGHQFDDRGRVFCRRSILISN